MHAEKSLENVYRDYKRHYRKMAIAKNNVDMYYKMKNAHDEGQLESTLKIARNLLAEGSTPEFVQKTTGLSLDEIEKL